MIENLIKKAMSLFGASLTFFPDYRKELSVSLHAPKPLIIKTHLEKETSASQPKATNMNASTEASKKVLNKTKVYLLTKRNVHQKTSNNILLLLHTEDRLYSEQPLVNNRYFKLLFRSRHRVRPKHLGEMKKKKPFKLKDTKEKINPFRNISKRRTYFERILRPNRHQIISRSFRGGKTYYFENKGGYKSICPVFFDRQTAEEFLIASSNKKFISRPRQKKETFNKRLMKGLKMKEKGINTNQNITSNPIMKQNNPFTNIKLIEIGLGDFLEYYSFSPQKKVLQKTEFLFFPNLKEIKIKKFTVGQKTIFKGLTSYQKDFCDSESKNL